MKNNKAADTSRITTEMLKASSDVGVRIIINFIKTIVTKCAFPDDWPESVTMNMYKGKSDALHCGNYRNLKLIKS